ncbi:CRISPR-associated protein Cas4 [Pontivivens insulae]|uniref:CRISPR-associated protein Cas4 n=1 Tax=Pontivivens insulae TaxID=1639689 RepID=UPI001FE9F347|nr:CRISPR-associated protein Cas4 [Pontivivens insulae]
MSSRSESIPLSALQHWLFCPRQCALIHVERLWEENRATAEGRVLHERVDQGMPESREGKRIVRSAVIASKTLRVHGVADVVELYDGIPYPVEYKRGRPKAHRADEVQLCAQAICLEEMTGHRVAEGALFYGARKRRTAVTFDGQLRGLTASIADEAFKALSGGHAPPAIYDAARCEGCSLYGLCAPNASRPGAAWLARRIAKAGVPE